MKVFADTQENHFEFDLKDANGESFLSLNNIKLELFFRKISASRYLLCRNNKTYKIAINKKNRGVEVMVDGTPFKVTVIDEHTRKMQEVIKSHHTVHAEKTVKAQIPGLIVEIMVEKEGLFKAGQPLLILEAMKMENVIKAPFEGQVLQILVKAGDTVNQGQSLIKIKPL